MTDGSEKESTEERACCNIKEVTEEKEEVKSTPPPLGINVSEGIGETSKIGG